MENGEIIPQITADGSHTLYIPLMDEHYHSTNGAETESRHVYVSTGFDRVVKSPVSVLEIGFGTGLNALLTLLRAEEENRKVYYRAIEKYPLSSDMIKELNYSQINREAFEALHDAEWNKDCFLSSSFVLHKEEVDLGCFLPDRCYDVIYFDAFAPNKQPEMWQAFYFKMLYDFTADGGVLTTYCAKGEVRRMLKQAGYEVERLAGPPGKREILRATKRLFGQSAPIK